LLGGTVKKITKLRLRLLEKGLSQREVARRAGLKEGLMSLIINGHYIPDERQKTQIAKAIQLPEDELFERVYRL
jgi:transcriptional regulator with XRE-family HTH domain